VKIRAQAMNPATGRPFYSYPSPWSALRIIYKTEGGIAGMYRCVEMHPMVNNATTFCWLLQLLSFLCVSLQRMISSGFHLYIRGRHVHMHMHL
jgi:hypothetical protein